MAKSLIAVVIVLALIAEFKWNWVLHYFWFGLILALFVELLRMRTAGYTAFYALASFLFWLSILLLSTKASSPLSAMAQDWRYSVIGIPAQLGLLCYLVKIVHVPSKSAPNIKAYLRLGLIAISSSLALTCVFLDGYINTVWLPPLPGYIFCGLASMHLLSEWQQCEFQEVRDWFTPVMLFLVATIFVHGGLAFNKASVSFVLASSSIVVALFSG